MTPEEKAKAYDEAIYKVAHFIKKHIGFGCMIHPNSSEAKELFNIFPELQKESDDERIRKEIIDFIYDKTGPYESRENTDKYKSWIAWLENEPIDPDPDTLIQQRVDALAWIEEDEKVIHCLEYTVKHFYEDEGTIKWCIDWLKSIEDRVQPQPKQEWSEEDEYIIEEIEAIIDAYALEENNPKALKNWLKSLRPRDCWKPSDAQMAALNDINLTGGISYSGQGQELINLYNDLKKIKG